MPVEVVHFNPTRKRPGVIGKLAPARPVRNFGDLIGPLIVEAIVKQKGLNSNEGTARLLTVGSIMHFGLPGDVVWGTGINGKEPGVPSATSLDVRAVRGPRTRDALLKLGADVPPVYGDPALLWPLFWGREYYEREGQTEPTPYTVVPNLHDRTKTRGRNVLSPIGDPHAIINRIVSSRFVCGSSLHGIILAEAFGIPARLIVPGKETLFKYEDYYAGTGRQSFQPARTVAEAIQLGGEPPVQFDSAALLKAFPADLWKP